MKSLYIFLFTSSLVVTLFALRQNQGPFDPFQDDIDLTLPTRGPTSVEATTASRETFYPAEKIFKSGKPVYINLNLRFLRIKRQQITTTLLTLVKPVAVEKNGSYKFLKFRAQINGENIDQDLYAYASATLESLQPAFKNADPVATLVGALNGAKIEVDVAAKPPKKEKEESPLVPSAKPAKGKKDEKSEVAKAVEALDPKSIPVPTPRPDPKEELQDWGDSRITEGYWKNKGAQPDPFTDVDADRFDPKSNLGKKIVAGWSPPVDVGETMGEYYFVVDYENPVPILTADGQPTGQEIEPGAFVVVELLRRYTFDPGTKKYKDRFPSPIVKFRTSRLFHGEEAQKGYLHIGGLMEAIAPVADLKALKLKYDAYIPRLQKMHEAEDAELTVNRALKQFHNSICSVDGIDQASLWAKWSAFVSSKADPRAKQVALNAQHVDIVARTIMGETQRQNNILDPRNLQKRTKLGQQTHPEAERCQIDIITLSLRNRAAPEWYGSFYGNGPYDFTSVSEPPSQYNMWRPGDMANARYRITSCPYSDDQGYLSEAAKRYPAYKDFRGFYERIISRVPKVLGITDDGKPALTDNSYLNKFFVPDPEEKLDTAERTMRITHFVNYYHPGAMNGRGQADGIPVGAKIGGDSGQVMNGFIRITHLRDTGDVWIYYPVVNGLMTRFDDKKEPHNFRILITGKATDLKFESQLDELKVAYNFKIHNGKEWVDPNVYFRRAGDGKIVAHLMEYKLEANSAGSAANRDKVIMPSGVFPNCFEKDGYIGDYALKHGYKAPYSWFAPAVRNRAADAFDRLIARDKPGMAAFQGGSYYRFAKKKSDGMFPIKLSCVDEEYERPDYVIGAVKGFPDFGSECDPNIIMARKPPRVAKEKKKK